MKSVVIIGKSAAFGILFVFLGAAVLAVAMYVYVHYVNDAYKHALAIGQTWDAVSLLRYWGLSAASIQWLGLAGPVALFLIGFVWRYRWFTNVEATQTASR